MTSISRALKISVLALCAAGVAQVSLANELFEPPANETERATLIDRLIVQKDWKNALNQVEEGLKVNPKSAQLKFKRAVIYERAGQTTRAKALLEDFIASYPEIVEPYNNLAAIYASEGNINRALSLLNQAVTINPGFALGHENLGDLYLQKAISHYKNAVRAQPANNRMNRKLKAAESLIN